MLDSEPTHPVPAHGLKVYELTEDVATVVQKALRGYFKGITITTLVTAPIFMVPVLLLRVPLAGSPLPRWNPSRITWLCTRASFPSV